MMEIKISNIVQSLAGRDSGEYFFVVGTEENFVHLADGKTRRIESPKRKKLRHIRYEAEGNFRVTEKLKNGDKVTNSELRRALAQYRADAKEQEAM